MICVWQVTSDCAMSKLCHRTAGSYRIFPIVPSRIASAVGLEFAKAFMAIGPPPLPLH